MTVALVVVLGGCSAPPKNIPGAPTQVSAIARSAGAELNWLAPEDDGGSAVTGYTVISSPGEVRLVVTTTRATVTGLDNGTRYTFTVTATNSVGTSPASAPSNEIKPTTTPSAPTSIIAMAGNKSATVSWTQPLEAGGGEVTGYSVRDAAGAVVATTAGATQVRINGLVNGTSYAFTVAATNEVGSSVPSPFSNAVTPQALPEPPTMITAVAGDGRANLSWVAPTETGGSAITGYSITSDPGGLSASTSGATRATVLGLLNGTAYTFTVRAENSLGAGLWSAPSNSVTPATLPGTPSNVIAVAADEEVSVTWDAPFSDGGGPITSYTVTANPGGRTATSAGARAATVTGLINGTSYVFTVRATNWAGEGLPSNGSNPVTPLGVPDAPTSVTGVRSDGRATVSWVAPSDVGGTPITGFTVTSLPNGLTANTTGATQVSVPGLINGTSYTFTVSATNAVGTSPQSAPSDIVIPSGPPNAPTGVTAVAGDRKATVSWTAAQDNGAPITLYTVNSGDGGVTLASTSGTVAVVTGLTNGQSYTFRVGAQNLAGAGSLSFPSNPVTPATIPGVATQVTATPGDMQATVSWVAAPSNGSPITRYTVTCSDGRTVDITGATSMVFLPLTNGVPYTFTVTATNAVGVGGVSAPSAPIQPRAVPGAPTAVTAVGGTGQATVAWTAPTSDGTSPITGYVVTSSPSGVSVTVGLVTQITITGINWSASHTFTVRAINAAGRGPASTPSNTVVLFSPVCAGSSLAMGGELPQLNTAPTPTAVKLVDLDGDGKLDLVIAFASSGVISTRRGNGDGTFQAPIDSVSVGGNGDKVLATGDLNGDGRLDVVVGTLSSSVITVLLADSSGALATRVDSSSIGSIRSLSLGDFDHDGKLDLLVANNTGAVFMRGAGTGSFTLGPAFGSARAVANGDFDSDGNLDAVIVSNASAQVSLGNGDGTFRAASGGHPAIGTAIFALAFEANADGRLDLAVLTSNGLTLLLGRGDGTFAPPGTSASTSFAEADSLASADLNADGFPDLVYTAANTAALAVRRGDGLGAFAAATTTRTGTGARSVTVGDVNGDGTPDVAVVNQSTGVVTLFTGVGDGTFLTAPAGLTVGNNPIFMASGDFNGDGRPDLAVANYGSNSVSTGLGQGDGRFTPGSTYGVGTEVTSVISVDLDADGKLDLITTNRASNSLNLMKGLGNGSFQNSVLFTLAVGTGPAAVAATDLNGDGRIDLAVANHANATLGIHLANGSGGFVATSFPAPGNPHAIQVADFNGDGKLDVVLGLYNSAQVGVLLGNGDGTFLPQVAYAVSTNPHRIALGDFDNDGALDLAVAHMGTAMINLLKGNGDGTFQAKTALLPQSPVPSIVARDMDLDGKLDLVAPNNGSESVSVYRGRGDGTFFPALTYLTGSQPYIAVVDDFNGDGSPDIATCSWTNANVSVLLRSACLP